MLLWLLACRPECAEGEVYFADACRAYTDDGHQIPACEGLTVDGLDGDIWYLCATCDAGTCTWTVGAEESVAVVEAEVAWAAAEDPDHAERHVAFTRSGEAMVISLALAAITDQEPDVSTSLDPSAVPPDLVLEVAAFSANGQSQDCFAGGGEPGDCREATW